MIIRYDKKTKEITGAWQDRIPKIRGYENELHAEVDAPLPAKPIEQLLFDTKTRSVIEK